MPQDQNVPETKGLAFRRKQVRELIGKLASARGSARDSLQKDLDLATTGLQRQEAEARRRAGGQTSEEKAKSLQERVRERRQAEREAGIKRGKN